MPETVLPVTSPSGEPVATTADPNTSAALLAPLTLGIPGLTEDGCDLLPGGMYALKARTATARLPLFAAFLENAVRSGRPCALITASKPDEFLARLQGYWEDSAERMLTDGRLKVFSTQEEVPKKMFRYGADRFMQELGHFGIGPGSVLLYDQADDLLSLHDPLLALQQVEVLAKGFQANQVTTLLSFSRPSDRQEDPFNALMDHFSGISRLGGDRDGLELTFLYWRASRGVTAARNFRLLTDDLGRYQAVEARATEPRRSPMAEPTEDVVDDRRAGAPTKNEGVAPETESVQGCLYNDPALDTLATEMAGGWLRIMGFDEILENAIGLERVSIVLNIGGADELPSMAEGVHRLRLSLSNKVQILVYANPLDLPPADSQLLLRCGANAVVPIASVPAQLPTMIRNLSRQVYIRRVEADFQALWERYQDDLRDLGLVTASPAGRHETSRTQEMTAVTAASAAFTPSAPRTTSAQSEIARRRQPIDSVSARQEIRFSRPVSGVPGINGNDAVLDDVMDLPPTPTIGKARRSAIVR